MNEKTIKIIAGLIIVCAVIGVLSQLVPVAPESASQPEKTAHGEGESKSIEGKIPEHLSVPSDEITVFQSAQEIAADLNSTETEPLEDIQTIQQIFTVFRKANGKNPFGSENFEVVAGLVGNNEKKFAVLNSNHPAINENGELEDRWGTPYFFHAESAQDMQIVSAGPDKQLFTKDDVQLPEAMSAPKENHELPEEVIVLSAE